MSLSDPGDLPYLIKENLGYFTIGLDHHAGLDPSYLAKYFQKSDIDIVFGQRTSDRGQHPRSILVQGEQGGLFAREFQAHLVNRVDGDRSAPTEDPTTMDWLPSEERITILTVLGWTSPKSMRWNSVFIPAFRAISIERARSLLWGDKPNMPPTRA